MVHVEFDDWYSVEYLVIGKHQRNSHQRLLICWREHQENTHNHFG
jgi:hypothetical protein